MLKYSYIISIQICFFSPLLHMGIGLRLHSNTAAQIILIILLGEKIAIASHPQEKKISNKSDLVRM